MKIRKNGKSALEEVSVMSNLQRRQVAEVRLDAKDMAQLITLDKEGIVRWFSGLSCRFVTPKTPEVATAEALDNLQAVPAISYKTEYHNEEGIVEAMAIHYRDGEETRVGDLSLIEKTEKLRRERERAEVDSAEEES